MAAKPTTIDEYLAAVSDDQRAALEKLRKTIRAAAPQAEECINYGIAAFRLDGRMLVGFGASANHCAFYPGSGSTVEAHKDELKGYHTSKGAIRFPADKPLPVALVRKLVKARIAENVGRRGEATKKGPRTPKNSSTEREPNVAAGKRVVKLEPGVSQTDSAVIAFLRELDHPRKKELETLRQIILGVSPAIREGIKWNSPSFRTTDWFATINLRAKDGKDRAWLILHTGAKKKDVTMKGMIADPAGLLEWLAKDRCLVAFDDVKDIQAKQAALQAVVREWIRKL